MNAMKSSLITLFTLLFFSTPSHADYAMCDFPVAISNATHIVDAEVIEENAKGHTIIRVNQSIKGSKPPTTIAGVALSCTPGASLSKFGIKPKHRYLFLLEDSKMMEEGTAYEITKDSKGNLVCHLNEYQQRWTKISKEWISLDDLIAILRSHITSLMDELASPQQEVRDQAAAALRKSYKPIPISKWRSTVKKIKKGESKKEILELLQPFNAREEAVMGGGGSYSDSYRLDNEWILICRFQDANDILIDHELTRLLKQIWTEPPKHYTGKWITYFINGQKSHEINYKKGKYFGEIISFHPDGSKSVVQHYSEKGADGKDTGYYPSGKISYQGQYKENKYVGTWTWYDENGNITSTLEYPK
jgi:hypothetical protein